MEEKNLKCNAFNKSLVVLVVLPPLLFRNSSLDHLVSILAHLYVVIGDLSLHPFMPLRTVVFK